MKRIIFILLLLPLFAQSQTGVKWDRYFFTGSMKIGAGLQGYANATLASQDSISYADTCALLEVGAKGIKRAMIVPRLKSKDSVVAPKMGMFGFDTTSKRFVGYTGTAWRFFDSVGIAYTETDPLSPHLSDSTVKYVTPAQLYALNYQTSLGFTPENVANKSGTISASATLYPNHNAVIAYAAPLSHTHTISQVTGLQVALDSNAKVKDSLIKWVTYKQLYDTAAAIRSDMGAGSVTSVNSNTGAVTVDLNSAAQEGNEITNINVSLNRTSGTKGFYLQDAGFNVSHWETNGTTAQFHIEIGDKEVYFDQDSFSIKDNAIPKRSALKPSNMILGNVSLSPGNAGTIAVTSDIPSLSGYVTQSDLDDTAADIRSDMNALVNTIGIQEASDVNFVTTNPLISTDYVEGAELHIKAGGGQHDIEGSPTGARVHTLQDEDGTIAHISQVITDAVTTKSPSENVVFDRIVTMPGVYSNSSIDGLATGATTLFTTITGHGNFILTNVVVTVVALTGSPGGNLTGNVRWGGSNNLASLFVSSANANAVDETTQSGPIAGSLSVPPGTAIEVNIAGAFITATVVTLRFDVIGYYQN